jgi:hypothetical protein
VVLSSGITLKNKIDRRLIVHIRTAYKKSSLGSQRAAFFFVSVPSSSTGKARLKLWLRMHQENLVLIINFFSFNASSSG